MKSSVRSRLLEKSDELFSRVGYSVTPVRDIMAAAKVVPRSFYDTYASKKELGLDFLLRKETESMTDLSALMRIYADPAQLFRAWVLAKKRQIKRGEFWGCPFLRFALQMPDTDLEFAAALRSVSQMWQKLLTEYLERAIFLKFLSADTDTKKLTRKALAIYEGNIAMWRISGEFSYVDQMSGMFQDLLDSQNSLYSVPDSSQTNSRLV